MVKPVNGYAPGIYRSNMDVTNGKTNYSKKEIENCMVDALFENDLVSMFHVTNPLTEREWVCVRVCELLNGLHS